jgi:hypothetical protein
LTALEDRTYSSRPNINTNDWTLDAIDAARLGLASEVQNDLVSEVTKWQRLPDGMATGCCSTGNYTQPYIEEIASTSAALDEAFVQDYDGLLRIAPAWPSGWDGSGSIYIHDGSKVDVQVEGGTPVTVAIEAGATETMNVRNPWPGQAAEVVDGSTGDTVVASTTNDTLAVPVQAGKSYLVEEVSNPTTALPFVHVTGTPATKARTMGSATIGIPYTATVGTVLGSTNHSYGVTEVDYSGDGVTTPVTEAGYSARQASGQSPNDVYFNVADSVAYQGTYAVTWTIDYYDNGTGSMTLQYDDGSTNPYKSAGNIRMGNTNTWKTATLSGSAAYFGNKENAGADFRLTRSGTAIIVHSLVAKITGPAIKPVIKFPPSVTITSPPDGFTGAVPEPIVSGTSEPDAAVTVQEAAVPICTAMADDDGNWSCTPSDDLDAGWHTITASATDPTTTPVPDSTPVTFYVGTPPAG